MMLAVQAQASGAAASLAGDLRSLAPEIALAVGALAVMCVCLFAPKRSAAQLGWLGALASLVVAGFLLIGAPLNADMFFGAATLDPFAWFIKAGVLMAAGATLLSTWSYWRREGIDQFEIHLLFLLSTAGLLLMASASDLITVYLAVELQSLPVYVLAAIRRDSLRSSEAGLKYFVLGSLSSGLLLYGASLVYGFAGDSFSDIAYAIETGLRDEGAIEPGLIIGLILMLCGLAFKISAAPFHMWTPDVYEGAPTPITAFLAAAPKLAGIALIMRLCVEAFGPAEEVWTMVIAVLAAASMIVGAFGALLQRNIKRLLAYSSIGHMGYALGGLAAGGPDGAGAVLFYTAIYVATTLGAFAVVLSMRRQEGMVETIDDLAGLWKRQPGLAIVFGVLVFSLAGIPPLAGFFGKWFIFQALTQAELYWLAVILVLSSAVAAYYYLNIIVRMAFDEPVLGPFERVGPMVRLVAVAAALIAFPLGAVFGDYLKRASESAAAPLFGPADETGGGEEAALEQRRG